MSHWGKVFAMEGQGQLSYKKLGMAECACSPRTGSGWVGDVDAEQASRNADLQVE